MVSSSSPRGLDTTMASQITTFVNGLSLSSPQAQPLEKTLVSDSNLTAYLNNSKYLETELISLACYVAQIVLGADSVDQTPISPTEVETNWSEACWETPTCAITPNSAKAVSNTLKIVDFFQLKFAIRSGGHSPNPGWSSINQPGILIDLVKLNQITLSPDKIIASLGPGGRWGDVYAALDPYNVSVVGGRLPQVGVGGLLLGGEIPCFFSSFLLIQVNSGGYFHFSSQYGLAADNVKNFEIVLADGSVTEANAQQNSDLFWALKGGGPNFGIVTRFDLYTIPVKDIWYTITTHTLDQVPAILGAYVEWQKNGASNPKGAAFFTISLEGVTLLLIYSEPANNPAVFAPFYSISPAAVVVPSGNYTVNSVIQLFAGQAPPQRHDYRAVSSKIDLQLYNDVYTFWRQQALAIKATTGANQTFVIQPFTANLVAQGNLKGGNPLGIASESFQCWTTLVDWDNAQDDTAARSVSIATTQKWTQLSQQRGLSVDFLYMNDAARDQDPLATYGADNLAKLKAISRKYDPLQVFQKLQNDGFLLSKA
ncbi:Bifunctional solanapyrone synthase [Lachnellula suecica]|uniref:Bifunctional solanapyrone synthase n=1 Tax=Lachnellula suecica TaxID=602035 RepID=A0A8T9C6K2_9HELO|nr:Bifunctional solanapyrone synthase [Lachnellula suecica]